MNNEISMNVSQNVNFTRNQSTIGYNIVLPFVGFMLHPLLGIIAMFVLLASDRGFDEKAYYGLYAMIGIFWGLVNTTRIPESDLLRYKETFDSASTLSFSNYFANFDKEILYYVFSYFSNKILFGNFKLYLILVTFIQFYLVFLSMHKLFKNESKYALLIATFFLLVDVRVFFSSVHLLRQMLAGSLFVYYFVTLIVDKKNKWWLVPIFGLIHSSSIILFLLTLIPKLKKRINNKNLLILISVFAFVYFFGSKTITVLDSITRGIPFLNYPFYRYQIIEQMEYSWYDGSGVAGIRRNLLLFFIFPITMTYLFKFVQKKYYWIMNICLVYILILEMYVSSGLSYMQLRMAYYLYWFMPILLTLFILSIGRKFSKTIKGLLFSVLFAYFLRRFIKSFLYTDFLIASLDKVLINPTFIYIYDIFL